MRKSAEANLSAEARSNFTAGFRRFIQLAQDAAPSAVLAEIMRGPWREPFKAGARSANLAATGDMLGAKLVARAYGVNLDATS